MAEGTQRAYYNEFDKAAAQRLRSLIAAGLIPAGDVDERSIEDVTPADLAGYTQCHFFAGIGGWPLALRIAGWSDSRPAWTGSCPCQPFSQAGKGAGFEDERHLWPAWQHLIAQRRPPVIFGEQVAGAAVGPWIDLVHADLEGMGYAFGCVPFPAASVGAPHIRDRTYWLAYAGSTGLPQRGSDGRIQREAVGASAREAADGRGDVGGLGNAYGERARRDGQPVSETLRPEDGKHVPVDADAPSCTGWLADANGRYTSAERQQRGGEQRQQSEDGGAGKWNRWADANNGSWANPDWIRCTDGKWRPVEPIAQQMVNGISRGVGLLRNDPRAKEEINHAAEAIGFSSQVLLALRSGHVAEAIWASIGGRIGVPEATLLLAVMCEQSRELGEFFNSAATRCSPESESIVREMWQGASEAACPPPGRGCSEQLIWEFGNTLPELSQACPSSRKYLDQLRQFTGSPLANGVAGRASLLRGYGNAIVPEQAALFVRAYMECAGIIPAREDVAA